MLDVAHKPGLAAAAESETAAAMNKVLTAEREAQAALAACRREAERTLEAARREARRIDQRAESLAREIHRRTDRLARARGERIRSACSQPGATDTSGERVAAAVERLAARMTGADDA